MNSFAGMLQSWKESALAFLTWWRDELWGLVPEDLRARLTEGDASLVVAASPGGLQLLQQSGGRTRLLRAAQEVPIEDVAAEAARLAKAGSASRVGVRILMQSCFKRSVELPVAARADAASILDLDLERSTPFRLKDVYTATYIDEASGAGGKIKAIQLVTKREAIDPVLEELRAAGLSVDFVDCWDDSGLSAIPVNFLAARGAKQTSIRELVTAPRLLAATAAVLLVIAVALALVRYQSALDEVQERVAETRARAATVRNALESSNAAVADLARLQRLKLAQIPAVEVMEELAKLLPDSVWIADLRLEGDTLDLSGLARSGSTVLPLFERSKLFAEAALTAPLTFDQQEDKERFSLRVRVRQPGAEGRTSTEETR